MGLSLTLVPYEWGLPGFRAGERWLCYTRLPCRGARGFADTLEAAAQAGVISVERLLPEMTVQWYGDEGIETYTEDAYGTPLTWVRAEELATLPHRHHEGAYQPVWDAAWAYLRALPAGTPVLLYWH